MDSVVNLDVSGIDFKYLLKSCLDSGTFTEYKPFLKVLLTSTISGRGIHLLVIYKVRI